jgi:hypothetical protein
LKIPLIITCILSLIFSSGLTARTIKPSINFDVYSIDLNKKISNKINMVVQDLNYTIPIQSRQHTVNGFIEFDSSYLIKFRSINNNSRYIHTEEISEILSNQLEQTRLRMNFKQKYIDILNDNFSHNISVEVLDIERHNDNQVRCHFRANFEFPLQVKSKYQNLKEIHTSVKFKFISEKNNFFAKSKSTKLKLNLLANNS